MSKLNLNDISSGYSSTSQLNENFSLLEAEFEKVLYRRNPSPEPNQMFNDLDMNSNAILNASRLSVSALTLNGITRSTWDVGTGNTLLTDAEIKTAFLANTNVPNIVSFETAQDVRDFGNPPSWLKQISIRSADGGDFKRATTSEYSDLGTNQPSGMYVTDSTGAGWERVSPKDSADPIWFGAVGTASPSDITSNNVAVQLAIDSTKHVTVPRGVWYDWQSITMPDQSRLIDNSGYDYRSGVGLEQAYTRTILKTNNDTGFTNGNTEWLTADYHPAHIVQTFAPVQTDGCRASFISYIGSALNDTLHATQWTFEYVDASPLVTVTGYDNGVLPHVATKLHTIRHPVDAEDAGAHGFYGKPSVGYTYERFMAGLTTIASYFTKNFIGSDTLPGASTGHFIKLYKKGANVIGRMRVKDEEIELLTKNNWSLKLKNDGQVASLNGLNPGFKTTVVNAADYDNGTMVYAYWLNPPKPLFAVAGNWYDANGVVV